MLCICISALISPTLHRAFDAQSAVAEPLPHAHLLDMEKSRDGSLPPRSRRLERILASSDVRSPEMRQRFTVRAASTGSSQEGGAVHAPDLRPQRTIQARAGRRGPCIRHVRESRMYLIYLDDSHDKLAAAYSALAIPALQWKPALARLRAFRRSLRGTDGIYTNAELRAWKLVSGRGRPGDGIVPKARRVQIYRAFLAAISSLPGARLFNAYGPMSRCLRAFERLANRINRAMTKCDACALLFCDRGNEAPVHADAPKDEQIQSDPQPVRQAIDERAHRPDHRGSDLQGLREFLFHPGRRLRRLRATAERTAGRHHASVWRERRLQRARSDPREGRVQARSGGHDQGPTRKEQDLLPPFTAGSDLHQ